MATKQNKSQSVGIMPLQDRVLIKEQAPESRGKKTEFGIIIPDTVKEDRGSKHGTVIAVGKGRRNEKGEIVPPEVKVGDDVLFEWGTKIVYEGEEYYVVSDASILAVIK